MSFAEHAAEVTAMQEKLAELSRQADIIGGVVEREILPTAARLFAGSNNTEAETTLAALHRLIETATHFSIATFAAGQRMRDYLNTL